MEWIHIIYGLNICALIFGFLGVLIGWKFEFFIVSIVGIALTSYAGISQFCCFFTANSSEELNLFLNTLIVFVLITLPFAGYLLFHLIFEEKEQRLVQ